MISRGGAEPVGVGAWAGEQSDAEGGSRDEGYYGRRPGQVFGIRWRLMGYTRKRVSRNSRRFAIRNDLKTRVTASGDTERLQGYM